MSNPNELRFDVRDSFEEFLTGITEAKGGATDDRPIAEQAVGLMDELALMEELMGSQDLSSLLVIQTASEEPAEVESAPPPQYPSFQLD